MNVLLLVGTVLGVGALGLGAVLSLLTLAKLRAAILAGLGVAWTLAYGAGLVLASWSSHDTLLAPGETKSFCGFYLDCHVGVAVVADDVQPGIGTRHAAGTFHVLTLRFSSSAVRATLRPWDIHATLEAGDGTRYARSIAAESLLPGSGELDRPIAPGGSYDTRVVFDLPLAARNPRLLVEQGPSFKLPEAFLIGDEASVMHARTWLALPAANQAVSAR